MAGAKICGLSTAESVDAAVAGGAAFIGLNFFEKSPRYVTPRAAGLLAARARGEAQGKPPAIVAVTVDPSDGLVDEIMRETRPDFIQLHGKESPARAAAVRARSGAGIIKVLSVSDASDIAAAAEWDDLADHLMFDARPPKDSPLPGGMGARFDWTLLAGRRYRRPHFLAGGLDPWNVREALAQSNAPLADVSSGVERGPGIKDSALITAFLDAVRSV